jgi:SAM-dependent methyltransferase
MTAPAFWQEVEFGSYGADLPVWVELAEAAGGPVVELGAGAGRVALHLAGHGYEVVAVERDPDLAAELERLAAERNVSVSVLGADLASPGELLLPAQPALVIGPLHVIQVLDAPKRPALLARLRELMAPGGTLGLTVVDESTLLSSGAASNIHGRHKDRGRIYPDMRELEGWVYSSEPLWVQVGEQSLTVRRVRELVSPEGRMERAIHDEILHRISPEGLEREGADAGFRAACRRQIRSGEDEADSILVLLEVPE